MPTIIVLDVSLSMCRTVGGSPNTSTTDQNSSSTLVDLKQLANVGIGTLLDYLAQNSQLEQTALIVFSSLWELKHQFTRHHEEIKNSLYDLELYDKSNIVNAVRGVLTLKPQDWTRNGPINIVLITDGQSCHESMVQVPSNQSNPDSTSRIKEDDFHDIPLSDLEGQFDFPCKIQIVCLTSSRDPCLKYSIPFFKKLMAHVDTSMSDFSVIVGSSTKNAKQSAIWLPNTDEADISVESIENLFNSLANLHYKPYHATLSCGHLSSLVLLSPKPTECLVEPLKDESDDIKNEQSLNELAKETYVSAINKTRLYTLNEDIQICGFLPLADVASPAVTSRHLVFPIASNKFNETLKSEQILTQDSNLYEKSLQNYPINEPDSCNQNHADGIQSPGKSPMKKVKLSIETASSDGKSAKQASTGSNSQEAGSVVAEQDITKQPSFCVLLYNCLKQESMIAVCVVGKNAETNDEWYGMLHTHTDSKKRHSLMLSLLNPGPNPILWQPPIKSLGSTTLNADLPQAIRDKITQTRCPAKSYSSNSVIWLDPEAVQTDVQKILRHAKRAPDKAPQYYKELNRIRRAAISYGFYDVIFGLAAILEREKNMMTRDQSKVNNEENLAHIEHVVKCLREGLTDDSYDVNIVPP